VKTISALSFERIVETRTLNLADFSVPKREHQTDSHLPRD
jgi:hypothetical protein